MIALCSTIIGAPSAIAQPPTRDETALAALARMKLFLHEQKCLHARSNGTADSVNSDGLLVQTPFHSEVWIDRPKNSFRFFMTHNDHDSKELFFDGKAIFLHSVDKKLYTTIPLPGPNDKFMDVLKQYDAELPFSNFFDMESEPAATASITEAFDLGEEQVGGIASRHYAFRQIDYDWQVWIQKDGPPFPLRFITVDRANKAHPQYIANSQWGKECRFNAAFFEFKPPKDARQVSLHKNTVKKNGLPAMKKSPGAVQPGTSY